VALFGEQSGVVTGGQPQTPMGVMWLVAFVLVSVAEGAQNRSGHDRATARVRA
jgi:hypothetical protein